MPKIRLSGTITGDDDPARSTRAELLYLLFRSGWDINNANGDQKITLSNIEEKIIRSDAFLFTPRPTIEDMFKAISVFVGYQTLDRNLTDKPTILLNSDDSWNGLLGVLTHLQGMGTISQNHSDYLLNAVSPGHAVELLEKLSFHHVPDPGREAVSNSGAETKSYEKPRPAGLGGNVCVFCSATTKNESFIEEGRKLGELLAVNRMGCVSGAGKSGIMGAVVEGTVANGGWAAGSNVPHIIEIEGLPEGLSSFWLRGDIYTRMEVMIENADAFVIMPGGAGTVQELLALLMFHAHGDPLMKGKPVLIYNSPLPDGTGFWDPLITFLEQNCSVHSFTAVSDLGEIIPLLQPLLVP